MIKPAGRFGNRLYLLTPALFLFAGFIKRQVASVRYVVHLVILSLCLCMALSACDAQLPIVAAESAAATVASHSNKPRGLTLSGYNYTDRYIDQFSVNGQGGGNLFVSTPTSGGTNVCCISYTPGRPAPKAVTVRWQSGACKYKATNMYGETSTWTHGSFKEMEVPVSPIVPTNPRYFEVHFYPDGHIEAAITAEQSHGRLHLSEDREDRSEYPRCPNDHKPNE